MDVQNVNIGVIAGERLIYWYCSRRPLTCKADRWGPRHRHRSCGRTCRRRATRGPARDCIPPRWTDTGASSRHIRLQQSTLSIIKCKPLRIVHHLFLVGKKCPLPREKRGKTKKCLLPREKKEKTPNYHLSMSELSTFFPFLLQIHCLTF